MFEIPILAIVNEVYFRHLMPDPDVKEGMKRLRAKIAMVLDEPDNENIRISDFGTRRRFSCRWQKKVIETLIAEMGRVFFSLLEEILGRLPMVRSIYSAIKQIIDTFSVGNKEKTFSRAVLVEFPRRGCWTVGFLTHEGETQFSRLAGTPLVHVFVPTTPNPTGGYMILVPAGEVKALDVSVAEAMKMIVSGGAVVPGEGPAKKS